MAQEPVRNFPDLMQWSTAINRIERLKDKRREREREKKKERWQERERERERGIEWNGMNGIECKLLNCCRNAGGR